MAGSGKTTVTTPTDTEIRMSRVFDAPRDLVFEAHSSAEHMRNWWGPRKYETISAEVDFRPGGKWRVVHRGPDGDEYAFRGEFREIVPPERITWTFEFEGAPGQISVETVSFEERDGKTTVSVISDLGSKEARDAMLESGMAEGADETYDRLDEYLERLKARAS
jgi:uncharacterized protein YndB with AHSA1/START domain